MREVTDIHSHLLPGLDDGARSMGETIEVLKLAASQGVTRMIMTPHYHPGRYMVCAPQILETLEKVQEECKKQQIPITLYPGQECCYHMGLLEKVEKGQILTLAGSRCLLVEFEPDSSFHSIKMGLHEIRCAGYKPILAHYERYECLKKTENLKELKEREYLLQINGSTLLRKSTLFHRNRWVEQVKEGMADFVGSDCHDENFRRLHMDATVKWMEQNLKKDICEQMLQRNAEQYLFCPK